MSVKLVCRWACHAAPETLELTGDGQTRSASVTRYSRPPAFGYPPRWGRGKGGGESQQVFGAFRKGYSLATEVKMNVWVEIVSGDGIPQRRQIATVARIVDGASLDDFGLSLEDGKAIQRRLQEEFTHAQADQACQQDRRCRDCSRLRGVHDYRSRTVHSLFGICRIHVPWWRILCRKFCLWLSSGRSAIATTMI